MAHDAFLNEGHFNNDDGNNVLRGQHRLTA